MQHKLSVAEGDLDKLEGKLHEHKAVREEHESNATNSESLQRKIELLEGELDTAEKNLRETTDKCVPRNPFEHYPITNYTDSDSILRL